MSNEERTKYYEDHKPEDWDSKSKGAKKNWKKRIR